MPIEEIESMDLVRAKKWIEYFSIINGSETKEVEEDESNAAGFMHYLQGNKQ